MRCHARDTLSARLVARMNTTKAPTTAQYHRADDTGCPASMATAAAIAA